MGRMLYTNAVPTTLSGAITNSATSITVSNASSWPTGNFTVVCEAEIMYCISRSGNTLTVLRGQEGTTAVSHASGIGINHSVTAGFLKGFRNEILSAFSLAPSTDSLSADDDDFDDESLTGWTSVFNPSGVSQTLTEYGHRLIVYNANGGNNQEMRALVKAKTPSAGDWVQAGFQCGVGPQYHMIGCTMANGATWNSGRQVCFSFSLNENQFFLREFTGYNAWNSSIGSSLGNGRRFFNAVMHMRLVWNGTNTYTCMVSPNGSSWATLNPGGTSFATVGAVTHMGFHWSTWGGMALSTNVTYCRFSF